MVRAPERWWYTNHPMGVVLAPLGWLWCAAATLRRGAYRRGVRHPEPVGAPVVVVGNVTVGGTGKTPLVAWLAARLAEAGLRVGIVARGYRGRARTWPQQVRPDSDPRMVGDEAVLLARACRCPMAVGPDRVAAARALVAHHGCEVILSDDGLQHYRLARVMEIAVLDGVRRLGNRRCLPAGPLREPAGRLRTVDLVVANGLPGPGELGMRLRVRTLRPLAGGAAEPIEGWRGRRVHAVAGIGHPRRFFETLRRAGLEVIEHPFPDHHDFRREALDFGDGLPVVMTEKDAVKCERLGLKEAWVAPAEAEVDPRVAERVLVRLREAADGGQQVARGIYGVR